MFAGSVEETRGFFLSVWRKMHASEQMEPLEKLVAEIIGAHPEYHQLLDKPARAMQAGESGEANPFLHMGLHIALIEQLQTDRPNGVRAIYQQLVSKSSTDHHAVEHQMMDCLAEALWNASRNGQPPDEQNYLQALKQLLA